MSKLKSSQVWGWIYITGHYRSHFQLVAYIPFFWYFSSHLIFKVINVWYLDLHLLKLCSWIKQAPCLDMIWLPNWAPPDNWSKQQLCPKSKSQYQILQWMWVAFSYRPGRIEPWCDGWMVLMDADVNKIIIKTRAFWGRGEVPRILFMWNLLFLAQIVLGMDFGGTPTKDSVC